MAYSKIIRKITTGFSELFSNITLVRYNPDDTEQERFLVPIAHATKELYVMRLEADPDLDKIVQMTLPRLSFEMNGMTYDASRKQNTNIKNFAHCRFRQEIILNPLLNLKESGKKHSRAQEFKILCTRNYN